MLQTPLTKLLGIKTPIVSAAMRGASGSELAAQVSLAGGFGFTSPGPAGAAAFAHELGVARGALGSPPGGALPIGAGFICWLLDEGGDHVAALNAALSQRVQAVWFSFGADLGKWVQHVRAYDRARAEEHTTLIWILVNTVEEAEHAVNKLHADVLIVQGVEAGGHGLGTAPPLLTLLPLIQRALPEAPPLLAAGGLTSGAHVAAMLMLGAAGAVIGTSFLATPESTYPPGSKAQVLAGTGTVRTLAYDEVRRTMGWPAGVDGRALPNEIYEDKLKGISLEERIKLYQRAAANHDNSRSVVWAGTSVGLVNQMRPAGELVKSLHEELVTQLNRAANILG